jgi:hypothetical protein
LTSLAISEAGVAVKYNVYLRKTDLMLLFNSTDQSHVELAARLLKLAGIGAEVKRKEGGRGWRLSLLTTYSRGLGRRARRSTKKPKRS